ncbi:hypothetical protein [Natronobacterium texcoconense]|uniref:Uncharacterized protein n=1 Tax=Natronobacterium texcoconense TaxID=1095778 RepID=A0A1H1BM44_NATTX|nr:hypothetical protein [Natronobacterium texcoconense]SDQ53034.1 hypothetical protein SAMN04489842_1087 [Natronobacterium texcoconense]
MGATGRGSGSATVTRWSRALVVVGVGFFVAWQVAVLAGYPRSSTVVLGVFGFVFHVVFGKAYGLVPSYFARELAVPWAPAVHLPFAALGTVGTFLGRAEIGLAAAEPVGLALWTAGCLVFVGSLGLTVRDNLTGAETGTGNVDGHRERVDRAANAVVPLVIAYLLVGSLLAFFEGIGLESPLLSAGPATTHLLAAGTAGLLVFAIGFRLLPRLLVVDPRIPLVAVVLPAGAIGPALLAIDLHGGWLFQVGASLQAIALVAFAVAYADMYRRSERRRVGGWTILAGVGFGALAAVLGLSFAAGLEIGSSTAFDVHYRLAVGGFLGLTIVGVTYHFYPPAIASQRFVDDRTAGVAAAALAVGLALEATVLVVDASALEVVGRTFSVLGAVLYAVVLGTIFLERGFT